MHCDYELLAHKLQRWNNYITNYHLPEWDAIPDFGLYMDQVIVLLEGYLSFIPTGSAGKDSKDQQIVTSSTINNYVRLRIMPAPVKRKYFRVHIAYLIMILTMKQSISISDVQTIMPEGADTPSVRRAYEDYSQKFREIALFFNRQMQGAWDDLHSSEPSESGRPDERGATSRLVIESALIAGFSKILAEKLIRLCDADVEAVLAAEQAKQNE